MKYVRPLTLKMGDQRKNSQWQLPGELAREPRGRATVRSIWFLSGTGSHLSKDQGLYLHRALQDGSTPNLSFFPTRFGAPKTRQSALEKKREIVSGPGPRATLRLPW